MNYIKLNQVQNFIKLDALPHNLVQQIDGKIGFLSSRDLVHPITKRDGGDTWYRPTVLRLTAACSAIELYPHNVSLPRV